LPVGGEVSGRSAIVNVLPSKTTWLYMFT
jgi:hypothetical protein